MEGIVLCSNVILIPALNPDKKLLAYIEELISAGFKNIIVVDDGSEKEYQVIFKTLQQYEEVVLLRHARNFGKGRALKTGFNYFLNRWEDDANVHGIITVDSDGQHLTSDVVKVSNALDNTEHETLFLGTRNFDYDFVPFKSKFGNKTTSSVFAFLYGRKLSDTQTGLRGMSKGLVYEYLDLTGERFEYEINMLMQATRCKHMIEEVPIETVYVDNNNETHFRPVQDSWKIYKVMLGGFVKYIFSSLSSSLIDIVAYRIFLSMFIACTTNTQIFLATALARVLSSMYNFMVNKKMVFGSKGDIRTQMVKYYVLCVGQMLVSAGAVMLLDYVLGWNKVLEKVIVDTILFFISYHIQKVLVFSEEI